MNIGALRSACRLRRCVAPGQVCGLAKAVRPKFHKSAKRRPGGMWSPNSRGAVVLCPEHKARRDRGPVEKHALPAIRHPQGGREHIRHPLQHIFGPGPSAASARRVRLQGSLPRRQRPGEPA